jgi:hypothetical protein
VVTVACGKKIHQLLAVSIELPLRVNKLVTSGEPSPISGSPKNSSAATVKNITKTTGGP